MQNVKNTITRAASSVAVVLALGSGAQAQEMPAAEFAAFLEQLTAVGAPPKNVYLPGITSATVAPHGTGYASITAMNPRGGNPINGWDASSAFGLGFGNPADGVGVALQMNVTGIQPFGTDGDFMLKFSHELAPNTYVGLSANRLAPWGGNIGKDTYLEAMVTHFNGFGFGENYTPFVATFGISSIGKTTGAALGSQPDPGFFYGVGFGLTEYVGFGVSVKDSTLNAGFGIKVPGVDGLSITADVTNINEFKQFSRTFGFGVHYAFNDLF